MKNSMEFYLHIPFCVKKCGYCDFLSGRASVQEQNRYCEALLLELSRCEIPAGTSVSTVFIGGGTPSVIDSEWIICFLDRIRDRFSLEDRAEITLEANPGTLTREKLSDYKKAGVNRLSIGLQSADDRELALLGRIHTYEEFLQTYRAAREAGFDNINVDLMMAIPGQREASLRKTLSTVAALRPEHLSLYSLIIEPGTPFARKDPVLLDLPKEEEERRMYRESIDYLQEWGYVQYEISNFALPGRECRHNIGVLAAGSLPGVRSGRGLADRGNPVFQHAGYGGVSSGLQVAAASDAGQRTAEPSGADGGIHVFGTAAAKGRVRGSVSRAVRNLP